MKVIQRKLQWELNVRFHFSEGNLEEDLKYIINERTIQQGDWQKLIEIFSEVSRKCSIKFR